MALTTENGEGKMGIVRKALLLSIALSVFRAGPIRAQVPDGRGPIGSILINELLASNVKCIADPQGEFDDWIELYNSGSAPVDVGGTYLTDNLANPTKWQIPLGKPSQTTIAPRGYLLIWTDQDTTDPGLHATFSLDAGGEDLALFDYDGVTVIDSVSFGRQRADVSFGRMPDGSDTWSLTAIPTPGGQNVRSHEGFIEQPQMSPGHGFYDGPILVSIISEVPGCVIYYTMDGSDPYVVASDRPGAGATVYSSPIQISKTTCLRAVATRTGWKASPVQTQTYIFVDDVIRQSPDGRSPGPGWPSGSLNGQAFDYGMDPDVVNHPLYEDLMDDALLSIPSISLVTDPANLFDPAEGIYVNARREGRSWERPVSAELIRPDGGAGFQIDAGIRIRGGFSRTGSNAKHSFRLLFRGEYGAPALKYPLFESEGPDEFENIDLRTAQNYAWSLDSFNPGEKNTFVREVFCRDLQRETGQPYTRSRYYHLYLNGQYWGLYQTQERSEASYAATYFGGEAEDYDVVTPDGSTDGTIDEWHLLWDLCQQGFNTDQRYYAVQGKRPDGTDDPNLPVRVDVVNLIDYMLGIFYTGNDDAPVGLGGGGANNFFAIRNRRIEARQGWQFFAYDNEHSLGTYRDVYDDRTAPVSAGQTRSEFNPQWLHQKLMVHPEYRLLFADHAHRHFFHGGVMTPEKAIALCLSRANQIDMAIIAESARWGDRRPSRVNNPYTRAHWSAEVHGYLIGTYFPIRTQIVLDQLRNRGLYPPIDAPVFHVNGSYRHGGYIGSADVVSMTGDGTVWYTLDGSDPRIPSAVGEPIGQIKLIAEDAPKRVLVPTGPVSDAWRSDGAFDDSGWIAGTGGVGFERDSGYEPYFRIDVESLMYGRSTMCYIRIPFSLGDHDIDNLSRLAINVRCDDGFVAYINGIEVARRHFTGEPAWNSAADAQNADNVARNFEEFDITKHLGALRPDENLLAVAAMNISTNSTDFLMGIELVSSESPGGVPSDVSPTAMRYSEPILLPHSARVKARALAGTTWSALNEAVFAVGPVAESVRVSEIMYHPPDTGNPEDPNAEYIELTNIGDESVNLRMVRFNDGIDFTFGDVTLDPAEHVLVVKDRRVLGFRYGPGLPIAGEHSGSLSNSGERIELQDALGATIQAFTYADGWYKSTDGDGYSLTATDPGIADPGVWSDKSGWRPSASAGGSPGHSDAATD